MYDTCRDSNPDVHNLFAQQTVKDISPFTSHFSRKRTAFTLAEVLITLGIIGVVAALTMPVLIARHQEQVTVNKLLKAYSIVSQAFKLAQNEQGSITEWFDENPTTSTDEDGNVNFSEEGIKNMDLFWDKMVPYLNVLSRCKASDTSCQKYDNVYLLNGNKRNTDNAHFSLITLNDGVVLGGGWFNEANCNHNANYCGDFNVDINGINKGPNTIGKDIFYFIVRPDAILPLGTQNESRENYKFEYACNPNLSPSNNGYPCTAWVLYNKNLDYLRCPEKLGWDKASSCK